jgi:pyridoxamine 5'-phosphate oxidase
MSFSEDDLDPEPTELFSRWFAHARDAGQTEPEAMAVATSTPDGMSSVRFVLLRGFDRRGFVFYTNFRSRKGRELEANPYASLAFRWATVDRQVRATGPVSPVDPAESDAYFASRPHGHQLGAWASDQSEPIADRGRLEDQLAEATSRYGGGEVPRPPWWGGYRIAPVEIEFWQQGQNRLHDRFRYVLVAGEWVVARLNP